MVEIKRNSAEGRGSGLVPQSPEDEKYRLLYSKSKVYIHPTAYARDNIPGFVALVKRVSIGFYSPLRFGNNIVFSQDAINATYLLAWIPESLLNQKGQEEWNKFVQVEETPVTEDEDEGMSNHRSRAFSKLMNLSTDGVLIDLPLRHPETYAFSVPLSSVYSLIVHPPSLSTWRASLP